MVKAPTAASAMQDPAALASFTMASAQKAEPERRSAMNSARQNARDEDPSFDIVMREHPGRMERRVERDGVTRASFGAATSTPGGFSKRGGAQAGPHGSEIIRKGDIRLRLNVEGLNGFAAMKATMKEMGYDSDDEEGFREMYAMMKENGYGEGEEGEEGEEHVDDGEEGHAPHSHAEESPPQQHSHQAAAEEGGQLSQQQQQQPPSPPQQQHQGADTELPPPPPPPPDEDYEACMPEHVPTSAAGSLRDHARGHDPPAADLESGGELRPATEGACETPRGPWWQKGIPISTRRQNLLVIVCIGGVVLAAAVAAIVMLATTKAPDGSRFRT